MVGVFDSPDGCSVWCSVTLGRLIDMLPPSPPSLRLLFLHLLLLLRPTHFYEDGYQPPPPPFSPHHHHRHPVPRAAGLERMRWDLPLRPPKKMSMFGIVLMAPIYHCQIYLNCLWEVTAFTNQTALRDERALVSDRLRLVCGVTFFVSEFEVWKSSRSHRSMSENTCPSLSLFIKTLGLRCN